MAFIKQGDCALHQFNGQQIWEYPPGSGQMFNGEGNSIGQWRQLHDGSWEVIPQEAPPEPETPVDVAGQDEDAHSWHSKSSEN